MIVDRGLESPNLLPHGGEVFLWPEFLDSAESQSLFQDLEKHVQWKQEPILMFGKRVMQPRLTAWYGDPGAAYRYSGIRMEPLAWIEPLSRIKEKIESRLGTRFNSVLLNYYRNGSDSMGWHRDNEPELGENPVIASLSLGAPRRFCLRAYRNPKVKTEVLLPSGGLLVMRGECQTHWEHSVPKSARIVMPRINLTFRWIR